MNSSPERKDQLSFAQMESILRAAFAEISPLHLVVFAGGEPMLLQDDLLRAIALCKEHGVLTRVVTNGYWASSPEAAREKVAALRAAGLDELNLSTDDYHLPWISLQRLKYAFAAAQDAGFLSVALANCAGPNTMLTPGRIEAEFAPGAMQRRFDDEGVAVPPRWQRGRTLVMLSNANLQRIGRAVDHIPDADLPPCDLDQLAEAGGCPWAIRSAAISPRGHLLSCCGFELEGNPILDYGDATATPLPELLDRADGDLISNMIAVFGPPKIKQVLEHIAPDEVSFPRKYTSYCEVCSDLVNDPRNRAALYRHQAAFAEAVLQVRERLADEYGEGDKVHLPLDLVVKPAGQPPDQLPSELPSKLIDQKDQES
jgi:hypothetical protein